MVGHLHVVRVREREQQAKAVHEAGLEGDNCLDFLSMYYFSKNMMELKTSGAMVTNML